MRGIIIRLLEAWLLCAAMLALLIGLVQAAFMWDDDVRDNGFVMVRAYVSGIAMGDGIHSPGFGTEGWKKASSGSVKIEWRYWVPEAGYFDQGELRDYDGDGYVTHNNTYNGVVYAAISRGRAGYIWMQNGQELVTWTKWANASIPYG